LFFLIIFYNTLCISTSYIFKFWYLKISIILAYITPIMSKTITLSFGLIELHEDFAIGILNEGIDLKSEENNYLLKVLKDEYGNKPFGFISNRIHSYSLDPIVYKETTALKNLMAIAVVMSNPVQIISVEIEKLFFNKPFEYFDNLDEAVLWIQNALKYKTDPNY